MPFFSPPARRPTRSIGPPGGVTAATCARRSGPLAAAALVAWVLIGCQAPSVGRLELWITDGAGGPVTPARVELLGAGGAAHIAEGALPVAGDCGWLPLHNWLGRWTASLQMARRLAPAIRDPYAGADHFYASGPVTAELPPGRYSLRVFKGIEYRVARREVELRRGETARLTVELDRWIDRPAEGWLSADGHLHIARPHRRFDRLIALWMAAEDLHVANLLQMGLSRDLHLTAQRRFGDESAHRHGATVVASGQENPRSHVFGHVILLGARRWIDYPESYLAYDRFWREARRQGGVTGYAHAGLSGGEQALATWGPEGLLDFVEVLGLGLHYYGLWYELLDLGLRVAPTAGSDFPCGPGLPGRERFYARAQPGGSYRQWLEAVRRGRTSVTNGPILDLAVGGAGVGDELRLDRPGEVAVSGRARFDPERDRLDRLELVAAGGLVVARGSPAGSGEMVLEARVPIPRTTWLALRASGVKRGEEPVRNSALRDTFLGYLERQRDLGLVPAEATVVPAEGQAQVAAAHTGAVWIEVAGSPPLARQPRARRLASAWLARLGELEARLSDEGIEALAGFPGRGDGMTAEDLLAARPALLRAIRAARGHWHAETAAGSEPDTDTP